LVAAEGLLGQWCLPEAAVAHVSMLSFPKFWFQLLKPVAVLEVLQPGVDELHRSTADLGQSAAERLVYCHRLQ
jgi:hypothetical protein